MATTKQLIKAAEELNEFLELDPAIDVKEPVEEVKNKLRNAATLIHASEKDDVTKETLAALTDLFTSADGLDEQTVDTLLALGILTEDKIEDEEPAEEKPEETEPEEAQEIDLKEEIEGAARLRDLKDIVRDEDVFKGLRGVLTKYNTKEELREVMLEWLEKAGTGTEDKTLVKSFPAKKKIQLISVNNIKSIEPFNSIFATDTRIFHAVKENMKQNGFDPAFPVILWNDTIIDGHTRVKAAEEIGIGEIPALVKSFNNDDEAIQYAIHNQRDRRNLTNAELIRCIELVDERRGRGGDRKSEKKQTGKSAKKTADIVGTSESRVKDVRTIQDSKDKKIQEDVKTGEKSISKAAKEIREDKKQKKEPTITRVQSVLQILREDELPMNTGYIAGNSNELYAEAGGISNVNEAKKITQVIIEVLFLTGWLELNERNEVVKIKG